MSEITVDNYRWYLEAGLAGFIFCLGIYMFPPSQDEIKATLMRHDLQPFEWVEVKWRDRHE